MDRLLKHRWSSPSVLSHHWQEFFALQAEGEKEFWQPNPPNATTCTVISEAISVWCIMFGAVPTDLLRSRTVLIDERQSGMYNQVPAAVAHTPVQ